MLRDHLRSCWRGVVNNRLATLINVGGLALGLAVFLALAFYVQHEFAWDAHWIDADRLYVLGRRQEGGGSNPTPVPAATPYVVGTTLARLRPDAIEQVAGVFMAPGAVIVDGETFAGRNLYHVERDFLRMYQFETLEGSLQEVMDDPRAVALSAESAASLFGAGSPLGRTLGFRAQDQGEATFTVKAVFRVPGPSTLDQTQIMAVLDPAALPRRNVNLDRWDSANGTGLGPLLVSVYLKLRPGAVAAALEAELRRFMDANRYLEFGATKTRFSFLAMTERHLVPTLFNTGNTPERLRVYAAIATLVLSISVCNFVLLASLRWIDRMREIGIRKSIGGEARQLVQQYLVDVLCQTLVATVLAVALLELSLPWLAARLGEPLPLDLFGRDRFAAYAAVVACITLASGIHPLLLLGRGKPAALLRESGRAAVGTGNRLRRLLVAVQFGIVIALLLASAVAWQQLAYTRSQDRGFDLEHVIGLRVLDGALMQKLPSLVAEFARIPGVAGAAVGGVSPGAISIGPSSRLVRLDGTGREAALQPASVGAGYFSVLTVPVLAGREFSATLDRVPPPDGDAGEENILVNAAGARALGFARPDDAICSLVTGEVSTPAGALRQQAMRIVGVVGDTQFSSLMLPPVPQWYRYADQVGFVAVRIEQGAERGAALAGLEQAWHEVMGAMPFLPLTRETLEGPQLAREEFEAQVVVCSSALAMVIALLGLYGLVAATVAKRVKEIGVRKALGAGRARIVALLLWQFSRPIVAANLVAWPLGLWGVSVWLQRFPDRLDLEVIVWSALAASVAALAVAWLTIGWMAARAASARPVLALRYE